MVSGDYATSILMARIGALDIAAGILLKEGELYVKKKWFAKFMERVPYAPRDLFLKLMGLDGAGKNEAAQCIRDLNQFIAEFQNLREQDKDDADLNVS